MCKVGCNWSEALAMLLIDKQVSVDYIKAGAYGEFENQFDRMRSLKPILLHGLGYYERTGMRNVDHVDFHRANHLIARCGSPHYGLHMAIKHEDLLPDMGDEEIYRHMCMQIQKFKKSLSAPLLLENIPDSPEERMIFNHHPFVEAGKIARLLHDNDLGLLLDLSHAKITARYRQWNVYGYLQELPLERVREIHVNGSGCDGDGFPADTHQALENEDYELLDWLLRRSTPDIVTLEYCGIRAESPETVRQNIQHQLTQLDRICRAKI